MSFRTTVLFYFVALTTASGLADALPKGPVTVTRVVDGDTLHVKADGDDVTIRVRGIDCPESRKVKKCGNFRPGLICKDEIKLGKAAAVEARKLLNGATVTIEEDAGKDVFRRHLAYVRLSDGRDFGLTMIEFGLCRDFGWKYPHPRMAEYQKAQPEAAAR